MPHMKKPIETAARNPRDRKTNILRTRQFSLLGIALVLIVITQSKADELRRPTLYGRYDDWNQARKTTSARPHLLRSAGPCAEAR